MQPFVFLILSEAPAILHIGVPFVPRLLARRQPRRYNSFL